MCRMPPSFVSVEHPVQRRSFLAGAAGLGIGLARPALAAGEARRVLRFVPQSDLRVLDPMATTAYATRNHGHLCWDTLYGLDAELKPQPQLAEGHVVEEDGRLWTFTLRQGPRFHDGEPVRAQDAVASIRRWMLRDLHGQTLATRLEDIRALDDRRFVLRLSRPFGLMLDALGKASTYPCFIYPERFARQDPSRAFTEVVGSGPYRYLAEERAPGSLVAYRRFENYSPAPRGPVSLTAGPKLALFDRLELRHTPDATVAAEALQSGQVDWWEQVAPDLRPVLKHDRNLTMDRLDMGGTVAMLRVNQLHPPFDNPALRRALLPALRQGDFMTAIMGDNRELWRENVGCFPEGSPIASEAGLEAITGPRDVEAAQRAVRAAGYKGEKVAVLHPTDVVNNSNLTAVATDLFQRVGLNAETVSCDWAGFLQRRASRAPVAEGGWSALVVLFGGMDLATPAGHPLLRANGERAWFGWPDSPKLEALRDRWFDTGDLAAQQKLGREIQRQFFQDLPYYPLGQYLNDSAWRSSLSAPRRGMVLPLNVKRV
ncbi:ABC transporter substrate-binding protein [Pseudoroseomonas deserti]|uniref:ABC transporter substrate-binding protein n=1 Tax=Teichococcus deserti TaxID=1817963 RepID=A0A1V2H065_9PROT|nr:ABC transporter substrate-binding protein [Pseudoroseomonas deserti]